MLKALIADDEELARRLIREYLRRHPHIQIVGEAAHGLAALEQIAERDPDLIFLDIQMPKLNGLEVLVESGWRTGIIFTTAYDQYALKAFDLHAVDYLLKPYSQERFDQALARAEKLAGEADQSVNNLLAESAQRIQRILVRDRGHIHVVAVESVDYVQAQDDYILIHADGKALMKTQRLSDLEAQLDPECFLRVHRSFLINAAKLQRIDAVAKNSHVALLHNGAQVPVSRAGYERLRRFLQR